MKPKGSQGCESVCHKAAARTPPPKGKHRRGGKIPALTGLQFLLPPWDDRMSSGANPKCRKDAAPTKFAPCHPKPPRERAPSEDGKDGFQSNLNKIKNCPPQSESAVDKSITISGVEPNPQRHLTLQLYCVKIMWLNGTKQLRRRIKNTSCAAAKRKMEWIKVKSPRERFWRRFL